MVPLALTELLLIPALTALHEHGKGQLEQTRFIPQMQNDLGAAPLLSKGALHEIGRLHILLVTCRRLEVVETGFRTLRQTFTRFGKGALMLGQHVLEAPLPFFDTGSIARVDHQRFEG